MFEVGKEVICINDKPIYSDSVVRIKKGQKYELLGIAKKECCGQISLFVGTYSQSHQVRCACGNIRNVSIGTPLYYPSFRFAPIDNTLSELTTADILKEPAFNHQLNQQQ